MDEIDRDVSNLLDRISELSSSLDVRDAIIDKLYMRMEKLEAALLQYANPDNWYWREIDRQLGEPQTWAGDGTGPDIARAAMGKNDGE